MTAPVVPVVRTAAEHPRFSGGGEAPPEAPPARKIDTAAARERVEAARNAAKTSDKPPTARSRRTAKDDTPAPSIPYTTGMFRAPVAMVYGQVGQVVGFVAYPIGMAITGQAGACGDAWDKVAKQNPTVRRWLMNMTKTGAWGELFAAHLPILMTTLVVLGPPSFRERMGGLVADSMDAMGAEQPPE